MSIKRALAIALATAAVLPASAAAQLPIPPPENDNYLDSYIFNAGDPIPTGDVRAVTADTTSYTLQDDMFVPPGPAGGPREPRVCEGYTNPVSYGKTIWASFKSGVYGRMEVTASSGNFDEVIRVVPFNNLQDAAPFLPGVCFDDVGGVDEKARILTFPNEWWAIQVGGTPSMDRPAQGGAMQIKLEMKRPPNVNADALLFWRTQPLRVTSLTAQGITKGAKVTLVCTKGACKKTTKTAKKPFWSKPVAAVGPAGPVLMKNASDDGASRTAGAYRSLATAAKTKFTLLKNRKVKKGATITVRVTRPGYIGKHFFWKVKSSSLTNKKVRCMNPGSTKPRKLGTCHG